MKTVLLLGATGMMGSSIYDVLKDKYRLLLCVRQKNKTDMLDKAYGKVSQHQIIEFDATRIYKDFLQEKGSPSPYLHSFLKKAGEVDYAINAIGIIPAFQNENPAITLFVNGAFPHILAGIFGKKLIHITTDCVYSGQSGFPYDEHSPKSPVNLYGLSKSLGEPSNTLTIRTSIIGRELYGFHGLLEWFLRQEGKSITGFANHFWNGITARQLGKICDAIISQPELYPEKGLFHIFSTTLSKYDMLQRFKRKFKINCAIKKDTSARLNRTLFTKTDLVQKLNIPSFDEMLAEL